VLFMLYFTAFAVPLEKHVGWMFSVIASDRAVVYLYAYIYVGARSYSVFY
jgi:hypothetical protein